MTDRRVLLISGSLRVASANTAALRTMRAAAPSGVVATLYDDLARLPHFNPDDDNDRLDDTVAALRTTVRSADALVFSVPEYAGALPGSFKNLLDWLIGDDQPRSIYEKPVAWINTSARGAALAHEQLRIVLGYAHAIIVEPACVHVPLSTAAIDENGLVTDRALVARIVHPLEVLARHLAGALD
jgi:NAD(P)H-dependent FMN reductase